MNYKILIIVTIIIVTILVSVKGSKNMGSFREGLSANANMNNDCTGSNTCNIQGRIDTKG